MRDAWCGRRVGPFQIEGLLGKGAMGAVYRARDVAAARDVALKVLLDQRLDDKHRARFEREGQVTAGLEHPHVVRVYSAGELPGGVPFLSYELVEGARSLQAACEGADVARRVAWVRDAARALGYAHARGVVHRDVKPDNLLVDAQGALRVADFGMAWAAGLDRLTRTGALVGTPYFMAPEQLSCDGQSARASWDVWALGVTLYVVLTGEYPFKGDSLEALTVRVVAHDPEPPSALRPEVSPALDAVCLRCLEKDPKRRYADGEALAVELDRVLKGEQVEARRPLVSRAARRRAALAAAPGLVFALGLVAVFLAPTPGASRPGPLAVEPPPPPPAPAPEEPDEPEEAPDEPAPPLPDDVASRSFAAPEPPEGLTLVGRGAWATAHGGVTQAMKALGSYYKSGKEGFPRDPREAARWYARGAELGDPDCMSELGRAHLVGLGVEKDAARAVLLLEQAAELGNAFAMRELGDLFFKGGEVERDLARALEWYERHLARKPGSTLVAVHAAMILREGAPGVPPDPARALAMLEAAQGKEAFVARELAVSLRDGLGCPPDEPRARALLERAAARDDWSLVLLAEMLARGRGGPRDLPRARALLDEAVRRDVRGAKEARRALPAE
ncbi:MAG: serine/threonine-protein kinase [Planctomycetes bacterium]|nr:serine/threonine-protein kinase [Planctomycetota bacterium]